MMPEQISLQEQNSIPRLVQGIDLNIDDVLGITNPVDTSLDTHMKPKINAESKEALSRNTVLDKISQKARQAGNAGQRTCTTIDVNKINEFESMARGTPMPSK